MSSTRKIRQIAFDGETGSGRNVSGPLQVGDDWPGVFIRGDEAAGLHSMLRWAKDEMTKAHDRPVGVFDDLMRWCEECQIGYDPTDSNS